MRKITISEIETFVEENSNCILLSEEYIGAHSKLSFSCECGNLFEVSYSNFKHSNKRVCNECSLFKLEKKKCPHCGKIFRPRNYTSSFCSHKCKSEHQKNGVKVKCETCNIEFYCKKSQYAKARTHFCCKECHDKAQITRVKTNCHCCEKEIHVLISDYTKYDKHFCGNECHGNFKKNPNITDEQRERGRFRKADKKWSYEVKKKWKGTCAICGAKKSKDIKIISHHLDGWITEVSKRLDVDNGICLCEECHKDFHRIYGYGNNTREQFKEYIVNLFGQGNTEVKYILKDVTHRNA